MGDQARNVMVGSKRRTLNAQRPTSKSKAKKFAGGTGQQLCFFPGRKVR
jgi:hypothetical protein